MRMRMKKKTSTKATRGGGVGDDERKTKSNETSIQMILFCNKTSGNMRAERIINK